MRSQERAIDRSTRLRNGDISPGLFHLNLDLNSTEWNAELEEIYGFEAGHFDGTFELLKKLVLPSDIRSIQRHFAQARRQRKSAMSHSFRIRRVDGAVRYLQASVILSYDPVGSLTHMFGAAVDVTDRFGEEAHWRTLFEQMQEGFMLCELVRGSDGTASDFIIQEVNETWLSQWDKLGKNANVRVVGSRASSLFSPLEPIWLQCFAEVVETGRAINFTAASAALGRWYQVHAYAHEGDVFAAVFLDVTEQKRLEEQAAKAELQRLRTSRLGAMGAMASTLAHELNQPLGAAANYVGVLERILPTGMQNETQTKEIVKAIGGQIMRAADIIRKMRSFASGGEIEREPEQLAEIVSQAAAETLSTSAANDVMLTINIEDDARLVLGSRVQLQQVFSNLVRNAVAAMQGQPVKQLNISARAVGRNVQVRVVDSGSGIPESRLNTIFDVFESESEHGLGLGLPLCRTIIEAHGGKITAMARTRGSEFRILLPAASQTESERLD